jgi:hypothetical protein
LKPFDPCRTPFSRPKRNVFSVSSGRSTTVPRSRCRFGSRCPELPPSPRTSHPLSRKSERARGDD